jgi:hypothetical protein
MPIVWVFPNREIEVTYLNERWMEHQRQRGEATDKLVERLANVIKDKAPQFRGASPRLVKTADIPTDRTNRKDWTLDKTTRRVRVMNQQEKDVRDREKGKGPSDQPTPR